MNIDEEIFKKLDTWVFNVETQAGEKLHVIDAIDLKEIIPEIMEVVKKFNYIPCCKSDSKQLPTKRYEIDFGGDLKCGIDITNNELKVVGAMNGWGNGVPKDSIHITEL